MAHRTLFSLRSLLLWLVFALAGTAHAQLSMTVNGTVFQPGDTIRVDLRATNHGAAFEADFYSAIVHPDGVTASFVTNRAPLLTVVRRLDGDAATFPPLASNTSIPQDFDVLLDDFFVHTLSAIEPAGPYGILAVLTSPRALVNSTVEPGEVLAADFKVFGIQRQQGRTRR